MKKSLHELDYMRLVMAATILLAHCIVFGNSKVFGDATLYFNRWFACMVVPYFYSLTGFFIVFSNDISSSAKKMAIKLFKLYVIWSLLYFPIHVLNYISSNNKTVYVMNAIRQFVIGNFPLWFLWGGSIGIAVFFVLYNITKANMKQMMRIAFIVFLFGSAYKYAILLNKGFVNIIKSFGVVGSFALTDDFVRNGVFFGFPFIALGMYIGECYKKNSNPGLRETIVGLFLSLVFGLIEVKLAYAVSNYDYRATANQLKIFLFPAIYYLTCLLLRMSEYTGARNTYSIRKIAALMFFLHWEIAVFVRVMLRYVNTSPYLLNLLWGIITLFLSVMGAKLIISYSKKYEWLKLLY